MPGNRDLVVEGEGGGRWTSQWLTFLEYKEPNPYLHSMEIPYSWAPSHSNRQRLSFPCPVLSFPYSLIDSIWKDPFSIALALESHLSLCFQRTRLKALLLKPLLLCNLYSSVSYCWVNNYLTIFPIYWSALTGIMPKDKDMKRWMELFDIGVDSFVHQKPLLSHGHGLALTLP